MYGQVHWIILENNSWRLCCRKFLRTTVRRHLVTRSCDTTASGTVTYIWVTTASRRAKRTTRALWRTTFRTSNTRSFKRFSKLGAPDRRRFGAASTRWERNNRTVCSGSWRRWITRWNRFSSSVGRSWRRNTPEGTPRPGTCRARPCRHSATRAWCRVWALDSTTFVRSILCRINRANCRRRSIRCSPIKTLRRVRTIRATVVGAPRWRSNFTIRRWNHPLEGATVPCWVCRLSRTRIVTRRRCRGQHSGNIAGQGWQRPAAWTALVGNRRRRRRLMIRCSNCTPSTQTSCTRTRLICSTRSRCSRNCSSSNSRNERACRRLRRTPVDYRTSAPRFLRRRLPRRRTRNSECPPVTARTLKWSGSWNVEATARAISVGGQSATNCWRRELVKWPRNGVAWRRTTTPSARWRSAATGTRTSGDTTWRKFASTNATRSR